MDRIRQFYLARTLQQRLLIAINGTIVVVLAALIAFQAWDTAGFAKREAAGRAQETAYRYGHEVSERLDEAIIAARTVAQTFDIAYALETNFGLPATSSLETCAPSTESSCIADLTGLVEKRGLDGTGPRERPPERHGSAGRTATAG